MEQLADRMLADRMKEDALFVGVFQAFEVHAMVEDLDFEPGPTGRSG